MSNSPQCAKVRATLNGVAREFTSQLFFPDDFTTALFKSNTPFCNTRGTRSTFNSNAGIYGQSGGQTLVTPAGRASASYNVTFSFTSQLFLDDALLDKIYTQKPICAMRAATNTITATAFFRKSATVCC